MTSITSGSSSAGGSGFLTRLFSFPDPVNEVSARLVAASVVVMALVTIVLDQPWLTLVLAYGFIARVLTGPKLSPVGQLVTKVVTPRLPFREKPVPAPPKPCAQAVGVVSSGPAAVLALGSGSRRAAAIV